MKKMLKVIAAVILTMSLLSGTVLACEEVYAYCPSGIVVGTGGDSNIRVAPDLDAKIIGRLDEGDVADYCGFSEYDWRGVRWDYINYYGTKGWVSSRYTTLY